MAISADQKRRLEDQARWSERLALLPYLVIKAAAAFLGCEITGADRVRRDLWPRLLAHPGGTIWVANHLTLVDPAFVYLALYSFASILASRKKRARLPFIVVEATNAADISVRRLLFGSRGADDAFFAGLRSKPSRSSFVQV